MRMKKVESLNIPARSEFYFQPGSTHIMLMGLNQELKDGKTFDLNFKTIENNNISKYKKERTVWKIYSIFRWLKENGVE